MEMRVRTGSSQINKFPYDWQLPKMHTDPRFAYGSQKLSTFITSWQNYAGKKQNKNVRKTEEGVAQHREHKRLNSRGDEDDERSCDKLPLWQNLSKMKT